MSIDQGRLYGEETLEVGRIAEHHPAEYRMTRVAEGDILFGRAVVKGTEDLAVKAPSASTDLMIGVAGFSTEASDLDNNKYNTDDPVAVVETGVVVVYVEEAVSIGDAVRIRHTASGELVPGSFCKTADAGKTVVVANAVWKSETASAGFAVLYIKGPFPLTADAA